MSKNSTYNPPMKMITLGDSGVGKTCILSRFVNGVFDNKIVATTGVDAFSKKVTVDQITYSVQVYDTMGQEKFRSGIDSYYRGCNGALFVYDITMPSSFKAVEEWVNTMKQKGDATTSFVLVGNKEDLATNRMVSIEEGQELAKKIGCPYIECSALTGTKIEDIFTTLIRDAAPNMEKADAQLKKLRVSISQTKTTSEGSSCC
ncbi:hypothetical protein EIN_476180 [Entamoeba invadens IP1]|uniref:Uncharacterized protein n=1 Tax=Entamoeba invadens IP1 TaxID=370355 RepID=A0A0A1U419_ENTIV|nr:hypothetical protein EIN_476180 [Entamoeba invadens IP1]ELP88906.1 hypothetical protein EIN_476180 [Entamoeba invadens IP1]|eukprot:XP_004255677.1 hypothetical protein EIN_476180 [Entamoeba invadens IP1]